MDRHEWQERYRSPFQGIRCSWGDTTFGITDLLGIERDLIEEADAGRAVLPEHALAILSMRWGVTPAYLLGEPAAERDLPEIRAAKEKLRQVLLERERELEMLGPRVLFVLGYLMQAEPDIFTEDFVSRALLIHPEDLQALLGEKTRVTRGVVGQVSYLSGVPEVWFWQWEANLLAAKQEPPRRWEAENGPIWPSDL